MSAATYESSPPLHLPNYGIHKDGRPGLSLAAKGYRPPSTMATASKQARSVDKVAIIKIASIVLKTNNVQVESYAGCLYRTYLLRTKDDTFCAMKCTPTQGIRLMRLEDERLAVEAAVLQLLDRHTDIAPAVLDHQIGSTAQDISHLISGPFIGSLLHTASPLSAERRHVLDRSVGRHIARLAAFTSRAFGPVLRPYTRSWAQCYASILEDVLRDAEDSLVSLPYDAIRLIVRKHATVLDKVTEPRLVLLGAAEDSNVVFDARTSRLTSLLDYGTAIWGDPFMSDYFCKPSKSFLEGYGEIIGEDIDARTRQML